MIGAGSRRIIAGVHHPLPGGDLVLRVHQALARVPGLQAGGLEDHLIGHAHG